MAKRVRELMSKDPIRLAGTATSVEAAQQMRRANVGAVIVEDRGKVVGIVTDRDIAVRAVAEGRDPKSTRLTEICSTDLATVSPDADIDSAIAVMREKAIRRVLVEDHGKVVGIVSLGDLAIERDARSVLGQISAAPPNQ